MVLGLLGTLAWNVKADEMAVTATISLDEHDLLYQQVAICTAELRNADKAAVRNVNPRNLGGGPTILLTNVDTGDVSRFSQPRKQGVPPQLVDLAGGAQLTREFALSDFIEFPGPGKYDLQAYYEWDGGAGEATSPPVRLTLRPSNPRTAWVESTHGGAAPYYAIAWSGPRDATDTRHELYLSTISTVKRPRVIECSLLEETAGPVQPYVSVPPNAAPHVQWVAWVADSSLHYLIHQSGRVSNAMKARLPSAHCRIVPPLLQNPPKRGKNVPGASVVLYERAPEATEGHLLVLHLSANGTVRSEAPMVLLGPAPRWAETAYLSNQERYTFVATLSERKTALQVLPWSAHAGLKAPVPLADWPGRCVAGDLWLTEDDQVVGALLLESGPDTARTYAFQTWKYRHPNQFDAVGKIDLSVPTDMGLEYANVSINAAGRPYAMVRGNGKGRPWFYCDAKGSVMPMPRAAEEYQAPMQVLFRRTTDPTIMYTVAGRGFQFAKPD